MQVNIDTITLTLTSVLGKRLVYVCVKHSTTLLIACG